MTNTNEPKAEPKAEEKPEIEDGNELIPLADEDIPESSTELVAETKEDKVVETKSEETPTPVKDSPIEQYIAELEKEVGTRRGASETPEAYALRLEVTKLKRERKSERKELFDKPKAETPTAKEPEGNDPLAGYNQDELSNFEKVFDAIAAKKGFVREDKLQAMSWEDKAQSILEDFQAKNKEYNDENLWTQFKEEFQSGKYNTRPQNPKLLAEIFAQIHNKLVPSKTINRATVAAGQEKIKAAAHGGTTIPKTGKKPIDPSLREALKGFTDEELEEMSQ